MKQIKFSDGCPNGCLYCYEPKKPFAYYEVIIPDDPEVQIIDMNFLAIPNIKYIIENMPKRKYKLVCGIDYRRLTQDIANLLHKKGFINIRWAWDYEFSLQKKHKETLNILKKAGYDPKSLSCFILVNYKIPYFDCCRKLDLLKVWNVKVNDCCYDGGYPKDEIDFNNDSRFNDKRFWKYSEISKFRHMSRKHNQIVCFGIDPEF